MTKKLKLLLLEDNPGDRSLIEFYLSEMEDLRVEFDSANTLKSGREKLKVNQYDIILSDLNMPDSSGLHTVQVLTKEYAESPLVVLTEIDSQELGLDVIKKGAEDYLVKAFISSRLLSKTILHAIERNKLKSTIQDLAYRDDLTGLHNRFAIIEHLKQEIIKTSKSDHSIGVMFFDLDGFKRVNDTLGHHYGDRLLKVLSNTIRDKIRSNDYLARVGGDEFMIVVSDLNELTQMDIVISRVLSAFDNPFIIDDYELFVTGSFGISFYPEDGLNSNDLIRNADIAMYKAKERRNNHVEYYTSYMLQEMKDEFIIRNDLRKALDLSELELYYQPIVNLETGKVQSAEVLLRWNHSSLGKIPPDKFIPIAESSGLILEIGEWVLRNACRQLKSWQLQGNLEFSLAVNISVRQLQQSGFTKMVKSILDEYDLDPKYLTLEITESLSMSLIRNIGDIINELNNTGIRISIDDFGTGYSSLSQLKELSISVLKIDKSFIHELSRDCHDQVMIKAIVSIAESLNLEVVAEGIEEYSQFKILDELGYDYGQGYYIKRPQPAEVFYEAIQYINSIEQMVKEMS